MRIIIQCAKSKQSNAGSFEEDGKRVVFVANPELAPPEDGKLYARPDDISDNGQTWRERLVEYNQAGSNNPLHLLPAGQLYAHRIYSGLVDKFGANNIFILSAGWGLIRADFLTPDYDITFSQSGAPYTKRGKRDNYRDFNQLPDDGESVCFLGGKGYHRLCSALLHGYSGSKILYYQSTPREATIAPLRLNGFECKPYETNTRTNWHYECAHALADGRLP